MNKTITGKRTTNNKKFTASCFFVSGGLSIQSSISFSSFISGSRTRTYIKLSLPRSKRGGLPISRSRNIHRVGNAPTSPSEPRLQRGGPLFIPLTVEISMVPELHRVIQFCRLSPHFYGSPYKEILRIVKKPG